jgi:hypothetical protein
MDTNTPNADAAQRWSRLAKARVRQPAPLHDRGASAATSARPQSAERQPDTKEKAQPVIAAPSVAVVAARFVTLQHAAAMTGKSVKAMQRKIERGIWVEGKHFRRRDGGVYIDMDAYSRWVEDGK